MATEGGKSFIRYDEAKEIRHANVQKERIVAVGKYLIQLRALHAGLNFKKSTLTKALAIVGNASSSLDRCLASLTVAVI